MAERTEEQKLGDALPVTGKTWLDEHLADPEQQKVYCQERVVVAMTEMLAQAMDDAGMLRVDVAEKIGRSKAFVTQVMSGRRNMTLRTFGLMLWACGDEIGEVTSVPLGYIPPPDAPRLTPLEVAKLAHSDAVIAMMDTWAAYRDAEKGSAAEKLAGPSVQPAIEAAQKALAAVRSEREKEGGANG